MKTAHFLKFDKITFQNLTNGSLDYTTNYARKFKLEQIMFKFSQAVTETVTITLDSVNGSNYDVILQEASLIGESSFVYRPQGECNFQAGDEIRLQCTNANLVGIVYPQIKTSEM